MKFEEYRDINKIKKAKAILKNVFIDLRNQIREEKRSDIKKRTYKNRVAFSDFIVGSGKHGIVLIDSDIQKSEKIPKFDIDCQIVISSKVFKNKFESDSEITHYYFENKLKDAFKKYHFQLVNFTHRSFKFYSMDSEKNFSFEILLLVSKQENNGISYSEIVVNNEQKFITNMVRDYGIIQKFKEANTRNREELVYKYINKKNHNKDALPNFLLLLQACNEVMASKDNRS